MNSGGCEPGDFQRAPHETGPTISEAQFMTEQPSPAKPHSSHWGAFFGQWIGDRLVITPHPGDPDPNPRIENFPDALRHKARIAKPMVRRGWLEHGPGQDARRGRDDFVEMHWDQLLDLLSA